MSMICVFSTISDESIELVRKHPLLIMKWFCSEEEFTEFIEHEQSKLGFFEKLFTKKAKPLPDYSPTGNESIQYDIDKAWFGIYFLLTGTTGVGKPPLNFLIIGGQEVKGCDIGYEPGRMFTSMQVKEIDEALQAISREEFESRFDPAKMMEEDIYPNIWDRPKEESLEYISENFVGLKKYIHRTAEQNMGMIVGLS
ncbi:MAG: YfbM family protein [Phycisphaerae bacterium]|nr:YfbM family protein [Phycisphaerae bacterium]